MGAVYRSPGNEASAIWCLCLLNQSKNYDSLLNGKENLIFLNFLCKSLCKLILPDRNLIVVEILIGHIFQSLSQQHSFGKFFDYGVD